jgi:hypothetical protein
MAGHPNEKRPPRAQGGASYRASVLFYLPAPRRGDHRFKHAGGGSIASATKIRITQSDPVLL